jgi:hypothetical protein
MRDASHLAQIESLEGAEQAVEYSFESLPRRIFLDSCTAQTLRNYGAYIYEGEPIPDSDRIHGVTNGLANIDALRAIFLVNECAQFEWIVSSGSMQEAHDKRDRGHMQWLWDIAHHSEVCLEGEGPTAESEALATRRRTARGVGKANRKPSTSWASPSSAASHAAANS